MEPNIIAFSTKEHVAIAVCDGDQIQNIEQVKKNLAQEILDQYIKPRNDSKSQARFVD